MSTKKSPRPVRRSSKPSTQSSSPRRSAHSDVTHKQHEIDKREQDKRKTANWLPMDDHKDLPTPDVRGPFWGDAEGLSFRWIAGIPVPCKPSELYEQREKLRREITNYKGRMMRKKKDGTTRVAWVSRPLTTPPIETTNLTLPPWAQAAIRKKSREEQKRLMKRITTKICKIAGRTKREIIGVDWHADTDKLHPELHTLRVDKKSGRIIEMPCTTTWHLGQDRLFRAGLEVPGSEEAKWREQAEERKGLTIDLEMSRAIDDEVALWIKEHKLEKETEIRRKRWTETAKRAKEKRILEKAASLAKAYALATGLGLLSAYAVRKIQEIALQKKRDAEIEEQLKVASKIDRIT